MPFREREGGEIECAPQCPVFEHGQVAAYVARMEIVQPEALRVTRAHKAFQGCARALRSRSGTVGDLYMESFMSDKVSCFWSHSWHGRTWMKILSLMMRYNGLPSVLVGSFTALIMMGLFAGGLLPEISRSSWSHEHWSTWSLASGFIAAVITFLLWQPRQLVFFDRICINENDDDEKFASIFSLAGILKRSDKMLVLWDATWGDRLWCLFELAAFVKSKHVSEQVLLIRPTFLGPCSIVLFGGMFLVMLPLTTVPIPDPARLGDYFILIPLSGAMVFLFITGYFMVAAFRGYFRSVRALQVKLRNISFDNTRCSCCDAGHVQDGTKILCDRQIVKECVSIWFGSSEAFEDCVRSAVLETLVAGLQERIFTRGWSLSVSVPLLWAFLDLTVSHAMGGHRIVAIAQLVEGLVLWFLCVPIFADVGMFFLRRYCQQGASTIHEILENVKVELIGVACFCFVAGTWFFLCSTRPGDERHAAAALFAGVWGTLALGHFMYKVLRKHGQER